MVSLLVPRQGVLLRLLRVPTRIWGKGFGGFLSGFVRRWGGVLRGGMWSLRV